MKKIFSSILALLAIFSAVSCNEDVTKQIGTDMKGVLGVAAFEGSDALGAVTTYEVGKRQAKNINLKAYAEEVCGVDIKVVLGADPAYVDVYNAANGTSYEMLPGEAFRFSGQEVIMPRFNKYSAQGQLTLLGQGCVEDQFYLLPVTVTKVTGTENYEKSETAGVAYFIMKVLPSKKGTGTKDDPFLIEELEDFKTMNEKLLPGDKVYFELKSDLDLTPLTEWTSLNNQNPYDCNVIFNGNGHKLSNFTATGGIFHVLNGSVENLVIENANVSGGADKGVLANYIGYTDTKANINISANVKNVTVIDSKFKGGNDSGLLSGRTYNALVEQVYMENCDIVLSGRRQGFLTGCAYGNTDFKDCYVKNGSASGGTQQCGGLIGQNNLMTVTVTNCGISATIAGDRAMGAIMAYAKGPEGFTKIENCIVWSPSVKCVPNTSNSYSSGVVVGCSDQNTVTFKNCLYRSDIEFVERCEAMGVLHNSDNIENAKLPTTTTDATTYKNAFAWHGVAADAGKTASQAAKALGWDEAIWDLSGAEPKLK